MNDLSTPASSVGVTTPVNSVPSIGVQPKTQPVSPSSVNKEVIGGGIDRQDGLRDATGQETTLSPEVSSSGVRIHPTTVSIPPSVAQMGVQPAGQNISVQTTTSVVLPLTDDQIAVGLHQSITNSFRWLSTWCVRRLKQVHIVLKNVHGKLVRIKE
jgi:hypothetical protein